MELRYSKSGFRHTFLIACLLTMMLTGLTWMISTVLNFKYALEFTAAAALFFFVFCSAAMIWRYYNNEIVFAVREVGLLDKRWSPSLISWDQIKEIVLLRREQEFELEVRMWPADQNMASASKRVNLSQFEIGIEPIVREIQKYKPVRHELS